MSIYEYLQGKTSSEISESGYRLPDLDMERGEMWVPGAYEGIMLRSNVMFKVHTGINFFAALSVRKQALKPSEKNKSKMLKKLLKYPAIYVVDPICSFCVAFKMLKKEGQKEALRALALDLTKNSTKRELVKFGIALLGICGKKEDLSVLSVLGAHDEFTLYSVGSAERLLKGEELNDFLMDLGEKADGWGKLSVLYALDYSDERAKLWAVKKGCRNTIGLSYAANVCATKGCMADALRKLEAGEYETTEAQEIFRGVCDIFSGLLWPEENQDGIKEYGEALRASASFKNICQNMPELAATDDKATKITEKLADC